MKLPATFIKKATSVALILILVLFSIQTLFIKKANAAVISPSKVTISSSVAGATATYTFNQTLSIGTAIDHIDIYFCEESATTGTCTPPTGMDTGATPTYEAGTSNLDGSSIVASQISNADNTIRLTVGSPDAQDPLTLQLVFSGIKNPTDNNNSFYMRMTTYSDATTPIDTAKAAIGILDTAITVQANVAPSFAFTLAAVLEAGATTVNSTDITVDSTATLINFGDIEAGGSSAVAAQDMTVITNAEGGYQVTIAASDPPLVSGDDNIDKFSGTDASPATWSTPGGGSKNTNSGFFGYTTEDADLSTVTGATDRFTSNKWAGATTTPQEVMFNASATAASGQTKRIGYQVQANGYQPPGAYSGTITLVATPTY